MYKAAEPRLKHTLLITSFIDIRALNLGYQTTAVYYINMYIFNYIEHLKNRKLPLKPPSRQYTQLFCCSQVNITEYPRTIINILYIFRQLPN